MSRFDAIISDIDGCLGPETNAPLDAHALAKIADHNRRVIGAGWRAGPELNRGAIFTVASGRPHGFAEAICRLLGNDALPCICENGVWLYDPRASAPSGHFLRDPAITSDHLRAVHEATLWIERDLGPRGVVIQPGKTASISIWHPDTALQMSLKPQIRDTFAKEGWPFRVSNTIAWINCDLAHVSKATGIQRLKDLCGLTTERLAGIGDANSDIAIREHVAWFACPANATDQLKKQADYVSPHAEVQGVLDVLAQLGK